MITLLIEVDSRAGEPLARTLASLIPAVVDGIVLDAIVINCDQSPEIEKIGDAAGAICVAGDDLPAAIQMARGDWLMCLEPGARLRDGWSDAVLAALARPTTGPGSQFRFRTDGYGLKDLFRRSNGLRAGLIIHKRQAEAAKAPTLEAMARGRAARRLEAWIVPAGT
jgi:hypothetical protein